MVSVVVYSDLSGKEPHRQVGVGRVMTSGSLGGVMVSTLARNARIWPPYNMYLILLVCCASLNAAV